MRTRGERESVPRSFAPVRSGRDSAASGSSPPMPCSTTRRRTARTRRLDLSKWSARSTSARIFEAADILHSAPRLKASALITRSVNTIAAITPEMSTPQRTSDSHEEASRILPSDSRYGAVADKGFNKRFRASPDYVRLVGSTRQVITAVNEAVREGKRLVATTGGHCLEGFVSDPDVRVIIDVSPMKRIYFDAELRAVVVEAGATVGETF